MHTPFSLMFPIRKLKSDVMRNGADFAKGAKSGQHVGAWMVWAGILFLFSQGGVLEFSAHAFSQQHPAEPPGVHTRLDEGLLAQGDDITGVTRDVADSAKRVADVVAQSTREAWFKTRAYFGEDVETYRKGADQRLQELQLEIGVVRNEAGQAPRKASPAQGNAGPAQGETRQAQIPIYFQTRVDALEQHLQYARRLFVLLTPEEVRKGREGPRKRLDIVLSCLENSVDLARKEMKDLAGVP